MDLKKDKKLKKKYNSFQFQVRKFIGYHLYRSDNFNAPFAAWKRLTEKPLAVLEFTDHYDEDDDTLYYYKYTKVDSFGNESQPRIPDGYNWITKDGEKIERNLEKEIVGYNVYCSTKRDLPLDQWQKLNEEILPTTDYSHKDLTPDVTYYYYVKSVSATGVESLPSEIISATAK